MTQMLLFDAVAETSLTSKTLPVVVSSQPAAMAQAEAVEKPVMAESPREDLGATHMGDLARLVLLRYDIVQKRRQQMAARRAK